MSRLDSLLGPMDKQTQWRVTVGGVVAGLSVFALWSLGLFASWGFPGFARAADLDQVAQQVKSNNVGQVSTAIFNLRRDQCAAKKEGRSALAYTVQLTEQLGKFYTLTGHPYDLPNCEDL